MTKWFKASKVGFWFYEQTKTKNWFTSKTFWNEAGQRIAALSVLFLGFDVPASMEVAAVIAAIGGFGASMWVRYRTTQAIGSTLQARDSNSEIGLYDESDDHLGI